MDNGKLSKHSDHLFQTLVISSCSENTAEIELEINISDLVNVADHKVNDTTILPGVVLIELIVNAFFYVNPELRQINNCRFVTPIIPSQDHLKLMILATEINATSYQFQLVDYATRETVYLTGEILTARDVAKHNLLLSQLIKTQQWVKQDLYQQFSDNGNQYSNHFKLIEAYYQTNEAIITQATIKPAINKNLEPQSNRLLMLEACIQSLAISNFKLGCPYMLMGCERISLPNKSITECYCIVSNVTTEQSITHGDVTLVDKRNNIVGELKQLSYKVLRHSKHEEDTPTLPCVITSTFSAEPLQDALTFWQTQIQHPYQFQFASYNQVIQELINPDSQMHNSNNAANILLIRLQDWLYEEKGADNTRQDITNLLKADQAYTLANSLTIAQLNQYETEYLYQEIFIDKTYVKHNIQLDDKATVIDIGANIGLFGLFIAENYHDTKVYCFEPSPPTFEVLNLNSQIYPDNIIPIAKGVASEVGREEFTYYPNSSVFSGFYPDAKNDQAAIKSIAKNIIEQQFADKSIQIDEYVDELVKDRTQAQHFECELTTVSAIIKQHDLNTIDLLKIDAEGSELPILQGISQQDWNKIQQIVIEVHHHDDDKLEQVLSYLTTNNFSYEIETEQLLNGSGLHNIYARKIGLKDVKLKEHQRLKSEMNNFVNAFTAYRSTNNTPTLIISCPPGTITNNEYQQCLQYEQALAQKIENFENTHFFYHEDITALYPVENYYNSETEKLGHIPYTDDYYIALGTFITRQTNALNNQAYKVIVTDCDNTLWQGICGEDPLSELKVTAADKAYQEFLLAQKSKGIILCINSKNNLKDVETVFAKHKDMVLSLKDFVCCKINWDKKSENLQSLSEKLNISLDQIVFIDDNPAECAEVESRCHSSHIFNIPIDERAKINFLKHTWVFDRFVTSSADRSRTQYYQQNLKREAARKQSLTYKDFLDSLNITIHIDTIQQDQMMRVFQLCQRTNQFNTTSYRFSSNELQVITDSTSESILILNVKDKYGDYGLVGACFYKLVDDNLAVTHLAISCRVLGKNVEYELIDHLCELALSRQCKHIQIDFISSERNAPAKLFLESIVNDTSQSADKSLYIIDPKPDKHYSRKMLSSNPQPSVDKAKGDAQVTAVDPLPQEVIQQYQTVTSIKHEIDCAQKPRVVTQHANCNGIDDTVITVWASTLNHDEINADNNFFDAGGDSINAVKLIAMLNEKKKLSLAITDIYQYPTLRKLSDYINELESNHGTKAGPSTKQMNNVQNRRDFINKSRARRRSKRNE